MNAPDRRVHLATFWVIQSIGYVAGSMLFDLGWTLGILAGLATAMMRTFLLAEMFRGLGRAHLVASPRLHRQRLFTVMAAVTDASLVVLAARIFDSGWAASQGINQYALVAPMVVMVLSSIVIALLCGPRESKAEAA